MAIERERGGLDGRGRQQLTHLAGLILSLALPRFAEAAVQVESSETDGVLLSVCQHEMLTSLHGKCSHSARQPNAAPDLHHCLALLNELRMTEEEDGQHLSSRVSLQASEAT